MLKTALNLLDKLALSCENRGDHVIAYKIDRIANLLAGLAKDPVVGLAAELQKFFPHLSEKEALHTAQKLYDELSVNGDTKESFFPIGNLANPHAKQGPRPEDVPVGTTEWWR